MTFLRDIEYKNNHADMSTIMPLDIGELDIE